MDAEDLIQETLQQFHAEFDRIPNLTPEGLPGLLACIQRRRWLTHRRKFRTAKREVAKEQHWTEAIGNGELISGLVAGGTTPGEALMLQEEKKRLVAAVERLPEKYRVVVRMHYMEGLPFPEIGKRLGITKNAAKLRRRKALLRLRSDLKSRE